MEDDIQNYSSTVMFRGTACIKRRNQAKLSFLIRSPYKSFQFWYNGNTVYIKFVIIIVEYIKKYFNSISSINRELNDDEIVLILI